METRELLLEENGLLGFGCMRFPTLPDKKIDREQAFSMLDTAYAEGVTYYDTAFPYHAQESETVLGLWQKGKPRASLRIATKLPVWMMHSAQEARETFEEQLRRLQTDYVDYYLLHALSAERWEKCLELGLPALLDEWLAQGKIRCAGFSFHDGYDAFERILNARNWGFCQLQLNYADTEIQAGLRGYTLAERAGVPVVVMEPVKGGRLARVPERAEARFRELHPDWSCASWALRWAASLPGVAVVLSGMSTPEQVRDNLETFAHPSLSKTEREAVALAAGEIARLQKVPCTNCGYCQPCPVGVEIPDIFNLFNTASMFDAAEESRQGYERYEGKQRASACLGCGQCVRQCPQGIAIPDFLRDADAFLTSIK